MSPVKTCRSGGRPGYKWGDRGKCYSYPPGDDKARREAKRKAVIQGIAAGERPAHALTGEQVSALLEEGHDQAEVAYLADLTAIYIRHILQLGELAQKRFALVAAAEWQPPAEGVLVTQAALDALAVSLARSAGPIWTRIVIQTALAPLARVEIAWDVKHPAAASLIKRASERTGLRLGDAMQPVLRKIVANAYDQGLNVRDTAEAIRSGIREASSWQADMLARTDLNSLANGASKAAAKLTGMGYKTWDCVDGSTAVSGLGVSHAARRIHDGEFVELTTVAGRVLTVTAEHPILTSRGWIAANLVHEGDELIRHVGPYEGTTPDARVMPDVDDMPAKIEEAFGALTEVRSGVGPVRVVMDLDSEGRAREVEVVAIDGELTDRFEPSFSKGMRQFALELTDVRLASLFATRTHLQGRVAHSTPGCCGASGGDALIDDLLAFMRRPVESSLGLRADRTTLLLKNPLDDLGRARPFTREDKQRLACSILFTYDRCVSVNVFTARRHVYDYTTRGGWMIANDLVVHNSTLDARTRPEHADAHAQTVPMDGMFTVGGEDADYPGDPNLSSAMACNCRCSLTYGESLDESAALLADGGVIMADVATRRQRRKRGDRRAAKPNETLAAESTVDVALVASPQAIGMNGTAGIEGKISDDNSLAPRVLMPESLFWPEMPVSFMAQTVTAEGHDGAEVAGRVDEFKRRRATGKMRNILFTGELTTPYGVNDIAPMIADKSLRYVSLDLGASEWAIVKRSDLSQVPQEDLDLQALENGEYALGLTSGKVKALTAVPAQAIEGAMVALTASADECGLAIDALSADEVLALVASGTWTPDPERIFRVVVPAAFAQDDKEEIAALVASPAPVAPPPEWFETQEPPGKMPLTITKEGRVYGHLAPWDSCHMSFLPSCVPPPKSPSNYAYFHVCELDTADGQTVTVGKLMFSPNGGHADRQISATRASQHYDRTGMAGAYLRVADGKYGIWAAGALNPAMTDAQREEMRRELRLNPPSGDWRPINGHYELICALAVAVPGFPVPRATVTITASADGIELEDAIIASSGVFDPDPAAVVALELLGLHDEEREAEERIRLLAARAEGVEALAALVD